MKTYFMSVVTSRPLGFDNEKVDCGKDHVFEHKESVEFLLVALLVFLVR